MTWFWLLPITLGYLLLRWFWQWLCSEVEVTHCDHSECEKPHTGDTVIEIFETKHTAGDGVEAGV